MNKPRKLCSTCENPNTEVHVLYNYMKVPYQTNPWRESVTQGFPVTDGQKEWIKE